MTITRNLEVRGNGGLMWIRQPNEQGKHKPIDKPNQYNQFENGTNIKYLPPNKSYKMMGVQINPMLDFRDHLKHINTEVRNLARMLTKRILSPSRKQLVIDQLLKFKYHATHLGIFTDTQLSTIDKILNKAARNALGLTPRSNKPTHKRNGSRIRTAQKQSNTNGNRTPHGHP